MKKPYQTFIKYRLVSVSVNKSSEKKTRQLCGWFCFVWHCI